MLAAACAVAAIFIACVAAGGMAWTTGGSVSVPLVLDIRAAQENGLPAALLFEPRFAGMLVLVGASAALSVASGLLRRRSAVGPGT